MLTYADIRWRMLTSSLVQAIELCLQHVLGVELRLRKQARLQRLCVSICTYALAVPLRQYLCFCTGKVELRLRKQARLQRLSASVFVLLY